MAISSDLERNSPRLPMRYSTGYFGQRHEISPGVFSHYGGTIGHKTESVGAANEVFKLSIDDLLGFGGNIR